jgi:hypothetical protein
MTVGVLGGISIGNHHPGIPRRGIRRPQKRQETQGETTLVNQDLAIVQSIPAVANTFPCLAATSSSVIADRKVVPILTLGPAQHSRLLDEGLRRLRVTSMLLHVTNGPKWMSRDDAIFGMVTKWHQQLGSSVPGETTGFSRHNFANRYWHYLFESVQTWRRIIRGYQQKQRTREITKRPGP